MPPQILALRRAELVGRERGAVSAVEGSVAEAAARAVQHAEEEAARAAAEEAARRKELKAWPPKVGPYDHTPKQPTEAGPLRYWDAEEGIVARQEDASLREGVVITRNTLPPRVAPTLAQRATASPGTPLLTVPGVYYSERQGPPAAEGSGAADAGGAAQPAQQPPQPLMQWGAGGGTGLRGSGAGPLLPPVDYNYPELGHSAIMANKPPGPSARNPVYDVYGQPRAVPPPLPKTYRTEQAMAVLNEGHIQAEGSELRLPGGKTTSGTLLRAAGKAAKQWVLTPAHIHFGAVPMGSVVHRTAKLRNTSTGPARFTVDRPPLPLRTIYKPGPVAAGMEAVLTVEFVAERPGDFVGEVIVRSEINVLVLTVSAKVVEGGEGLEGTGAAAAAEQLGSRPGSASAGAAAAAQVPVLDETRTLQQVLGSPGEGEDEEGYAH